jgi:23S rRNA (adenine2503-C2)-methyltransferase
MEALVAPWGVGRDQVRAIWRWLYRAHRTDLADLPSCVPLEAREALQARTYVPVLRRLGRRTAPDGETYKDLLALADDQRIEVVVMQYGERYSACISTQVGCACGCAFCATGQLGFVRQLTAGEIVAQVVHVRRSLAQHGAALSNFVLMGMGEPLLNYENTLAALHRLAHPWGMNFPERRMTLSTVGIAPGIRRLAQEALRVNLAVSLHAATDALRDQLLPINRRYPLDALLAAIRYYVEQTGERVMFEWVLIEGQTDTLEQARALRSRLQGLPAHVNLIPLNTTSDYQAVSSSNRALNAFAAELDAADIPHTVRRSRGETIAAGCGQLAGETYR